MGRAEQITKEVKFHDPKLYCARSSEGKLCIYRKSQRIEHFDLDGKTISFVRPQPHLIMALTHNWQLSGQVVDWGTLPIIARLKEMDLWNRNLANEYMQNYERAEEKRKKQFSSNNEDFLKEFRRPFAKAFSDVNTASMKKIDKRRLKEI